MHERLALGSLELNLKEALTPFLDFPQKKGSYSNEDEFKGVVDTAVRAVNRHMSSFPYFYLDNYDIDFDFEIDGKNNYEFLLESFQQFLLIPVISIDRDDGHISAVASAKDTGIVSGNSLALRFMRDEFVSFNVVKDEIRDRLENVMDKFEVVDLVLDCRVCNNLDVDAISSEIASFIREFTQVYEVRHIIVSGSSIPPSISDLISAGDEVEIERNELKIFNQVCANLGDQYDLVLGDYGVVSPDYSDVNISPEMMQNVITPKIIYSFEGSHYITRGNGIKTSPRKLRQYNDQASVLVGKHFYRSESYSDGDRFISEKSRGIGSQVTPATIIRPTMNAHITYMCKDYN